MLSGAVYHPAMFPRVGALAAALLAVLFGAGASPRAADVVGIDEARRLLAQADEQAALATDPRIASIARMNAESARRLLEAHAAHEQAVADLDSLRAALGHLQGVKDADEQRVRLAGAGSGPVSEVLLRHRESLPTVALERRDAADVRARAAAAEIARLDVGEELARLGRPLEVAQEIIRTHPGGAEDAQLVALLRDRATRYVQPLGEALAATSAVLGDEERTHEEFARTLEDYRNYVDAHLVWLPSMPPAGADELRALGRHLAAAVDPGTWAALGGDLAESLRYHPFRWVGAVAVLVALVVLRERMFPPRATGGAAGQETWRSIARAALQAAPLPAAMAMGGSLVESTPTATTAEPWAHALRSVAGFAYFLTFAWALCAPGGAAEARLGWAPAAVASLRRAALALLNLTVPALIVAQAALGSGEGQGAESLARWTMIAALAVLTAVSARIFRPAHGLFSGVVARNPNGWISILRGLWYPALVAFPAILAVAAAAGYVITAATVIDNLARSYWVILLLSIGVSLNDRLGGRAVERFDLAGELEARDEARFEGQVRRLGRLVLALALLAGFAWAWKDLIPAFSLVNSVVIWNIAGAAGGAPVAVTVQDALAFAITVVVTFSVVRDLPGIANVLFLRRFPIDRSARYALVTVARYLMAIVGLVLALACLRIRWTDVQWLAAAVTVGLGFGLQEIFANFVSGLILLVERPVRIGDLVTVDGVSGRVTRIATRATTMVDFDNKDVIIPNKQLVTGRIINWTLQEPNVRVVLRVGVPAAASLETAVAALREAAAGSQGVVANPGPDVALMGFSGGNVDLDVAIYVLRPSDIAVARHDLVLRATRLLRERGIAIAFPQLEIRTAPSAGAGVTA